VTEPIVALDVSTLDEVMGHLKALKGLIRFYKVGLQLYLAQGERAVKVVRDSGAEVFLDLKLLDIPQTVARAVAEVGRMGVHSVSLHLWGGRAMVRAASEVSQRPNLWGVSVLTSLTEDDLLVLGGRTPAQMVPDLCAMGVAQGLDGLVCSGHELPLIASVHPRPVTVVPGVRMSSDGANDQKRVITPREAAQRGADYVVVGRPITCAADPRGAAEKILDDLSPS
jgi:orotidine-5'-phosphate decarboxylase